MTHASEVFCIYNENPLVFILLELDYLLDCFTVSQTYSHMQAICIKSLDVFVFYTENYTNLTQILVVINTFGKETELL